MARPAAPMRTALTPSRAQVSDHKAQLSQIETERLLAELVGIEMKRRHAEKSKFAPVCFYLGYQARSSMPSNFDCDLGLTLGATAAGLIASGATACMATAHCLASDVSEWRVCGTPLYSLMSAQIRAGSAVAAIRPSHVDLTSRSFKRFAKQRATIYDSAAAEPYINPGPLQFEGPLAGVLSPRLADEHGMRGARLVEAAEILSGVEAAIWPGCSDDVLRTALSGLRAIKETLAVIHERDEGEQTRPHGRHAHVTQLTADQIKQRDN